MLKDEPLHRALLGLVFGHVLFQGRCVGVVVEQAYRCVQVVYVDRELSNLGTVALAQSGKLCVLPCQTGQSVLIFQAWTLKNPGKSGYLGLGAFAT